MLRATLVAKLRMIRRLAGTFCMSLAENTCSASVIQPLANEELHNLYSSPNIIKECKRKFCEHSIVSMPHSEVMLVNNWCFMLYYAC
jgi:hypothetical protein